MDTMDTCSATERHRGKLHICEKRLDHIDNHRDGEHEWTQEVRRGDGPNERVF